MLYNKILIAVALVSGASGGEPEPVDEEIVLPNSPEFGEFTCILKRSASREGDEVKFVKDCEAPRIRNLVFSGGGAKGVAYAGVVQALEEFMVDDGNSLRDQIESVSGSSAGAITAAFVAVGVPAAEIATESESMDLTELLDSSKSWIPNIIGKDGIPLYEWIREKINRLVCLYVSTNPQPENSELVAIEEKCSGTGPSGVHPRITFGDLRTLHGVSPHQFKRLAVIATDADTGRKIVFSWETFPDFEIALACRASASLPALLQPVIVSGNELGLSIPDSTVRLVDGGLVDNIPVEQATDPSRRLIRGYDLGEEGQDLSTLVFVFDESGDEVSPFDQIDESYAGRAYRPGTKDFLVRDFAMRAGGWVTAPIRNTVTKYNRLEDIRKRFTLRNVAIRVDGIKTTDFKKAKKLAARLIENGKSQTLAYLAIHGSGQWIHESYESPVELMRHVPGLKYQQLLDMGRGDVFGVKLEKEETETQVGNRDFLTEKCLYSFKRGSNLVRRYLTCLDDAEFVDAVSKAYPPRRKISHFSRVRVEPALGTGNLSVTIECFEESLMFGLPAKIGEYRMDLDKMISLLDLLAFHSSEKNPTGDRQLALSTDAPRLTFSLESAGKLCSIIDSIGFWELEREGKPGTV